MSPRVLRAPLRLLASIHVGIGKAIVAVAGGVHCAKLILPDIIIDTTSDASNTHLVLIPIQTKDTEG
jgi:hypothetical protein